MIDSITSLRWFAALYVFLFHVQIRSDVFGSGAEFLIINGYTGMAFFFILSGFVLGIRYSSEINDYKSFFVARLSRIYPAFILAFILSLPLAKDIHPLAYFLNFVLNLFLLQAWFPSFWAIGINGGTWSLSAEIFFYSLFPLFFVFVDFRKLKTKFIVVFLGVLWMFSFLPGVAESLFPGNDTSRIYYSVPIYRLSEFIIGVLISVLFKRDINIFRYWQFLVFALIIYLLSCYSFNGMKNGNLMLLNLTAVPFYALLILYSAQNRPVILEWRPFVYLGKISYGIYVYQFLFMEFIFKNLREILVSDFLFILCGLLITIALAGISYHFFENPMKEIIRRKLS
jgi:peptidoglycan/LPS O-acetylase OafA/YrhL